MMKKTLIASAIAAATFSGTASAQASLSAAELSAKIDSMPTVYGNIQYAVTHTDVEDGSSEVSHFDNGSTIGLKHDHEIAPGITAFLKLELEGISADNKAGNKNNTAEIDGDGVKRNDDSGGLNELDEAYIGIKGERFGQVWVGSDDSQYETLIDAIEEYYEVASLNIGADFETGEGDLLQYISPSFNGLTLHGAVAIQGDGDEQYDKKSYPYQLGVKYSTDMFMVALAMDSNDGSGNAENTYGLHAAVTRTPVIPEIWSSVTKTARTCSVPMPGMCLVPIRSKCPMSKRKPTKTIWKPLLSRFRRCIMYLTTCMYTPKATCVITTTVIQTKTQHSWHLALFTTSDQPIG
jgi:predicted porin